MAFFESFRKIIAFFEGVIVFFTALSASGGTPKFQPDYIAWLNETGIFANDARESLPQTAAYDVMKSHFAKPRTDGKTPKLLFIGYDGARADALVNTVGVTAAGTRALLADGGKIYSMYAGGEMFRRQETSTDPGWTTLFTGKWGNEKDGSGHGITGNGMVKELEPKSVITVLFDLGLIDKSSYTASWAGHFNAMFKNDIAYGQSKGYNAGYTLVGDDAQTYAGMLAGVQDADTDFVVGILEHCDHAGHGHGFGNDCPEYVDAIRQAESEAYQLIQAVKARPTYADEDWLIVITSDHGGMGTGHGQQFTAIRQTFFAVSKPDVLPPIVPAMD